MSASEPVAYRLVF